MKNKRKNNPFFSPEVQNLQDSINRITDAYSGYIQTILSSDLMISQMQLLQEEMKKKHINKFLSHMHLPCFHHLTNLLPKYLKL